MYIAHARMSSLPRGVLWDNPIDGGSNPSQDVLQSPINAVALALAGHLSGQNRMTVERKSATQKHQDARCVIIPKLAIMPYNTPEVFLKFTKHYRHREADMLL